MTPHRLAATLVCTAATLTALAACSSSGGGGATPTPTPTPATSSAAPSTTAAPSTSAAPSSPTAAATSSAPADRTLTAVLLTATDLNGFKVAKVGGAETALPCTPTKPPLTQQAPEKAKAEASFESASGKSAFQQTLLLYPAAAGAASAYTHSEAGFSCASGTLSGSSVTIKRVGAVAQDGYRGERWDYRLADGTLGTAVIGQYGSTFVGINFVATGTGSSEVDPGTVLVKALTKIKAHPPR